MWHRSDYFTTSEDGAVTADWMVLSVALIFLIGFIFAMLETGTSNRAQNVTTSLDQTQMVLLDVDNPTDPVPLYGSH
jgi:hypothetical protein